jgi:serine/threonine protein kinase
MSYPRPTSTYRRNTILTIHPSGSDTINHDEPDIEIRLIAPLKTGFGRGPAQVWKVELELEDRHTPVVAKIYDPRYNIQRHYGQSTAQAVLTEQRAYAELRHLQGSSLPVYLGLYSMILPSGNDQVSVALLQYIEGENLRSFMRHPTRSKVMLPTCEDHASSIIRQLADVYRNIYDDCNIHHKDFHAYNTMISKAVHTETAASNDKNWPYCSEENCCFVDFARPCDLRVWLIDFEYVVFIEDEDRKHLEKLAELEKNPTPDDFAEYSDPDDLALLAEANSVPSPVAPPIEDEIRDWFATTEEYYRMMDYYLF